MRLRILLPALLFAASASPALWADDAPMTSAADRAAMHATLEWQTVAPHLPDPKTGTVAQLEVAGDVLHARRFPDDAIDYYGYAIARGGDVSALLNKMGVVRLELRQYDLARVLFERTVKAKKKSAQSWNNLGVAEYSLQRYSAAITDYKRAARLDPKAAVFHSNLGMAYFETKDMESARKQLSQAVELDPSIMKHRENGGNTAHVLGSANYPELCFEMAKLYARRGDIPEMRLWLAKASEGGFDVKDGMFNDARLHPFLKDAEVKMMLVNSAQMRKRSVAAVTAPGLGAGGTQRVESN